MGLVDYSESDSSGSEADAAPAKQITKPRGGTNSKKIPSVVDKSKSGKIIVNLAGTATDAAPSTSSDEPPAKRARTTGGGGRFSGFNSFLPAPKNAAAATGGSRLGGGLKTSAAPGFSRDTGTSSTTPAEADATTGGDGDAVPGSSGLSLPPPKTAAAIAEPSIPEGQKPAAEVKLTGKPLMFRPLSVAKGKKKKTSTAAAAAPKAAQPTEVKPAAAPTPEPPKKKVSLFSIPAHDGTPAPGPSLSSGTGAYEPLFETAAATEAYSAAAHAAALAEPVVESVGDIADDMNLSAAARRELFGRAGHTNSAHAAAQRVVTFNMDREYRHNEAVRASGEAQTHNPVRALQGGGKHSLRQLVGNVQGQRDALEDSFAKGRANRKEASGRYGW